MLETLIEKYGLVVSVAQIFVELKQEKTRQEIYNLTSKLAKAGWLVRIRKGTYYIAGLESRGTTGLPIFAIAQLIEKDSYVSFEAALQYHGMFDQHLRVVRCISLKKMKKAEMQGIQYEFVQTAKKLFTGFEEKWEEGQKFRVATAEKALLDMLNFKRTDYIIDVVLEKLRVHQAELDWKKLFSLARQQNFAVQRTLGFLLDQINVKTDDFYSDIKTVKGYSRMTADSRIFNAKWRLYYSSHFKQQAL